jgi:hypothetical protein
MEISSASAAAVAFGMAFRCHSSSFSASSSSSSSSSSSQTHFPTKSVKFATNSKTATTKSPKLQLQHSSNLLSTLTRYYFYSSSYSSLLTSQFLIN